MRRALALLLFAAACQNSDNLVLGGIGSSDQTPQIVFDNIGSSISGKVTLSDENGTPIPDSDVVAVIISDRPDLCNRLKLHPDYFRKPPEGYIAMVLFTPVDRVGTFLLGRQTDTGTGSEIIGVSRAGDRVLPFVAVDVGYISVVPDDTPAGSFNLLYGAPPELNAPGASFPFSGRFKTQDCANLAGVLLP